MNVGNLVMGNSPESVRFRQQLVAAQKARVEFEESEIAERSAQSKPVQSDQPKTCVVCGTEFFPTKRFGRNRLAETCGQKKCFNRLCVQRRLEARRKQEPAL